MTRSVNPAPQYLDSNGDPIAGGKMFFFESGTNTDKATFKDQSETIPNTQPVILDAAGRLPSVFFTGSAKQVLNTADDTLVFERDPVGGEAILGAFTNWSEPIIYSVDNIVNFNGKFYQSLTNSNQGNQPDISPTTWEEIRFIGVYNVNISYSIGDVVQTVNGSLWRSVVDNNLNNDPDTDSGANWLPSVDGSKITEVAAVDDKVSEVIPQTVSGELTAGGQENQLRDSGAFTLPLASSVDANTILVVNLPDTFKAQTPTLTRSGSDLIRNGDGTDTDIAWVGAAKLTLTSDGVSEWEL